MIKFKDKIKELRYEADFYKGNPIKTYQTRFDENNINKLVYDLTITDNNYAKEKKKECNDLTRINKFIKWFSIAGAVYLTVNGLFLAVLVFCPFYIFNYMFNDLKKEKLNASELPTDKYGLEDLQNGKYLSPQDKKGVYSNMSLDFFENETLIYEYTYFQSVRKTYKVNTYYVWKEVQEACLINLDKLEKITYLPEGIKLEGIGYFPRYNGNTYYSYPYAFIPNYIENFDEILEKFKSISPQS
ncbi:MAG: hypothetical protein ACRCWG_10325 [Sarcina sp.]